MIGLPEEKPTKRSARANFQRKYMQPSPRHPPTRVRCGVSAPREMKRGGHSFVNATPRRVNTLPPHNMPTFLSLCYLFYCIVSKKIKPHTVFAWKIKGKRRAMLVWYKAWCYIVQSPPPLTPQLQTTACAAEGKCWKRLLEIYFSLISPLLAVNRGAQRWSAYDFWTRGAGVWLGFFVQQGVSTAGGLFTGCSHCMRGTAMCCPHCRCYE